MESEIDIVRDVSARLDRAGIDYMLTGSMAMNYYAQPRMTRDIDIVLALTQADATRFVQLFTPGCTSRRKPSNLPSLTNPSSTSSTSKA